MKKSLFAIVGLVFAGLAMAQGAPSASTYYGENSGRISVQAATYAAVNGQGGSLSHAQTDAGAVAVGGVSVLPGAVAVNGAVSGYTNATAYNTAFGSGVGSASAGGWSDASFVGNVAQVQPGGWVQGSINVDGGMSNPVRNGTDAYVIATTAQDGFVQASYSGSAALVGTVGQAVIPGGATVTGSVVGTQTADGQVQTGGVTFAGGAPAGQSAAVRFGNSGVSIDVHGSFDDPAAR